MKRNLSIVLCVATLFATVPIHSEDTTNLEEVKEQTDDFYRTGSGSQAATYSTIGKSMLVWGIGLSAAIAILASAIHQSSSSHDSTTTSE